LEKRSLLPIRFFDLVGISFEQIVTPKKPLSPHDVNDEDHVIPLTIKNANGRDDELAIGVSIQLVGD
jgi:hypothetical protein